ncbi:MAG: complex I subunit 4 family protein [Anaerolineae bacterium]
MTLETLALLTTLAAPLSMAVILVVFRRKTVKTAGLLAGLSVLLLLVSVFVLVPALQRGDEPSFRIAWMPVVGIELVLHLDWLSLPFLLTEAAVTAFATVYAWGYHKVDDRTPLFYALLLLFAVGMTGTTLADDLVLFYTFWELMLIASAALILFWGDTTTNVRRENVALKYVIFTHIGSLLVLVGFLVLYDLMGHDSFSGLRNAALVVPPDLIGVIMPLFLIGFGIKMAVFPLHLWLPDAHTVAPMPVTIMLAAAMLGMGTYGILRFPLSLFSMEQARVYALPMMIVGVVSEVYGALMALAEDDLKRIVAYSSVSQMGYILFGLGTLTQEGVSGATLHVIFHAIVKALLFMVVGIFIHATGKRQFDELSGEGRKMPAVAACGAIGLLAIAGVPPLCVFDSEWMIFAGGFHTAHIALSVITLLGSVLTVAYALRIGAGPFWGDIPPKLRLKTVPKAMLIPTIVLAALAVIGGIFPAPLLDWVVQELPLLLRGQW